MAGVALRSRRNVLSVLPGSDRAVVARRARSQYLEVIDPHHGREHKRVMAVLAGIRRGDVIDGLAESGNTIVATETVPSDADVVEDGWSECGRAMAVVALVTGRQVIDGLTNGLISVVAAFAHTEDFEVINAQDG